LGIIIFGPLVVGAPNNLHWRWAGPAPPVELSPDPGHASAPRGR
jgi:hypothetical protein